MKTPLPAEGDPTRSGCYQWAELIVKLVAALAGMAGLLTIIYSILTWTCDNGYTCPIQQAVAQFSASPLEGAAPLIVRINNTSTGTITRYIWDFGDGTGDDRAQPSPHIYLHPGEYTILLIIEGQSGKAEYQVVIHVGENTVATLPSPTPVATPTATTESIRMATALDNARVWSQPSVQQGHVITELAAGTELYIVEGPTTGPIRLDMDLSGDWYRVRLATETVPLGWVWSERLLLREAGDSANIRAFSRTLYVTLPRINGDDVRMVQTRLDQLGYTVGEIDGYYGPVTETAIRAFQTANQLAATGVVDAETWDKLFSG